MYWLEKMLRMDLHHLSFAREEYPWGIYLLALSELHLQLAYKSPVQNDIWSSSATVP
jgi:hypothetical protein